MRRGGYISVNGDVLAKLLIVNFVENGSNPLIRKEAAIAAGGFDESLRACQDWDLWLKLAARYSFVSVPVPQILYRLSPGSISSNVFTLEAACVKVTDRAFAAAPGSLQSLKKYSLGNTYKYLIFKSFEEYPNWTKGLAAAKFLYHVIENDPAIVQTRVLWKILLNIAIVTLLPPKLAHALRQNLKDWTNMTSIFLHFQTDPEQR